MARWNAVRFSIRGRGYIGTGMINVSDGITSKDLWCYNILNLPPAICLVTVDSASKHNNIVWDKTGFSSAVDSFIIYREIITNSYQQVGAVHFDSLSIFEDTVTVKYFPNTGNPNAGTYRYKLAVRDTCGNISAMGPYHNTIFMTNNSGTFSWPQLYTIEGSSNPVSNYELWRDDLNTGTGWHVVNSVAGTQQLITDPNYSSYSATANWRIQTNWTLSCTPTYVKDPVPMGTIKTTKHI